MNFEAGHSCAILGVNGVGKSTMMRIIMGTGAATLGNFLLLTDGRCRVEKLSGFLQLSPNPR